MLLSRPRRRIYSAVAIGLTALFAAQLCSLWVVSVPYYLISPGPTAPVGTLITVPPAHRHALHGEVLLTTVLQGQAHIIDFLTVWARHNDEMVSSTEIAGNLTPSQLEQLDEAEMTASQRAAEVVALRRDGYTVSTATQVVLVLPHTPASGLFHPGDLIVSINGTPTPLEQDTANVLSGARPGTTVTIVVQSSGGARRTVTATLTRRPDNPSQGFLGVELTTRVDPASMPFPISINSDGIGGPSAGLAFALGILDELTGGNLTRGRLIAATGTIDFDGTVGDVGGVAQKTVSVSDAGATLFLVPPGEYAAAVAHAGPDLKVVKVSTFEQALQAIAANGGSLAGLPPAPAGLK